MFENPIPQLTKTTHAVEQSKKRPPPPKIQRTSKGTEFLKMIVLSSLVQWCYWCYLHPILTSDLLTLFDFSLRRFISYLHFWRCGVEFQVTQRYKSLVVAPKHSPFFFTSIPLIPEIHFQCPYNEQFTWTLKKFSKMI